MSGITNLIDNAALALRKSVTVPVIGGMIVFSALIVAGCSSEKDAMNVDTGASISADPNPVPPGEELGSTTVTWETGDGKFAQVYVSPNGKEEKFWKGGAKGSAEYKYITGGKFEFTLYAGKEHQTKLASVVVLRTKQKGGQPTTPKKEPTEKK
jgi:hypothetical protein